MWPNWDERFFSFCKGKVKSICSKFAKSRSTVVTMGPHDLEPAWEQRQYCLIRQHGEQFIEVKWQREREGTCSVTKLGQSAIWPFHRNSFQLKNLWPNSSMLCKTFPSGKWITVSTHCGTAQHKWLIIIMTGCVKRCQTCCTKTKKTIRSDTHECPSSFVCLSESSSPQKQANRWYRYHSWPMFATHSRHVSTAALRLAEALRQVQQARCCAGSLLSGRWGCCKSAESELVWLSLWFHRVTQTHWFHITEGVRISWLTHWLTSRAEMTHVAVEILCKSLSVWQTEILLLWPWSSRQKVQSGGGGQRFTSN